MNATEIALASVNLALDLCRTKDNYDEIWSGIIEMLLHRSLGVSDEAKCADDAIYHLYTNTEFFDEYNKLDAELADAKKEIERLRRPNRRSISTKHNWHAEDPFSVPIGLSVNVKKGVKGRSEEVWGMQEGNYKCPYNCQANRTSLEGAKSHFNICPRRPDEEGWHFGSDGVKRIRNRCAETNNRMTKKQQSAYWAVLKHTNGKCGENAALHWDTIYDINQDSEAHN